MKKLDLQNLIPELPLLDEIPEEYHWQFLLLFAESHPKHRSLIRKIFQLEVEESIRLKRLEEYENFLNKVRKPQLE